MESQHTAVSQMSGRDGLVKRDRYDVVALLQQVRTTEHRTGRDTFSQSWLPPSPVFSTTARLLVTSWHSRNSAVAAPGQLLSRTCTKSLHRSKFLFDGKIVCTLRARRQSASWIHIQGGRPWSAKNTATTQQNAPKPEKAIHFGQEKNSCT